MLVDDVVELVEEVLEVDMIKAVAVRFAGVDVVAAVEEYAIIGVNNIIIAESKNNCPTLIPTLPHFSIFIPFYFLCIFGPAYCVVYKTASGYYDYHYCQVCT